MYHQVTQTALKRAQCVPIPGVQNPQNSSPYGTLFLPHLQPVDFKSIVVQLKRRDFIIQITIEPPGTRHGALCLLKRNTAPSEKQVTTISRVSHVITHLFLLMDWEDIPTCKLRCMRQRNSGDCLEHWLMSTTRSTFLPFQQLPFLISIFPASHPHPHPLTRSSLSFLAWPCSGSILLCTRWHWPCESFSVTEPSVYSYFSCYNHPSSFILEKLLFTKSVECMQFIKRKMLSKSLYFSYLVLAFYNISSIKLR